MQNILLDQEFVFLGYILEVLCDKNTVRVRSVTRFDDPCDVGFFFLIADYRVVIFGARKGTRVPVS